MILVLLPAALAAGFEVPWQSARVSGMGGAGTALSEDASAAWFNPAALADGGGLRAAAGGSLAYARVSAEGLPTSPDAPWSAETVTPPAIPPWASVGYARGRFAGSASFNAAYAGGVAWPEDWPYRFDVIRSSPQFLRGSVAGAVALGPVRLALGGHLDAGSLAVLKATDHISEEGRVELLLRGHGAGVDAAAFVEPSPHVAFGVSYKSRTALDLAGEADFDVPAPFAAQYPDQIVRAQWTLPDRLAVGVAVRGGAWRGTVDGVVTTWKVNDVLAFDFAEEETPDLTQTQLWRNSFALRGGAEWSPGAYQLRGGLALDGLPQPPPPASTLSPASPDCKRISISLGGSVDLGEQVALDLFLEHMVLLPRESESEDAPLARYLGHAELLGVGIRWR